MVFYDISIHNSFEVVTEDALALNISADFATKWIGKQWDTWASAAENCGLPVASLMWRSHKASKAAGVAVDELIPNIKFWSIGSPVVLLLLARWSATLDKASSSRAKQLLNLFVRVPAKEWTWLARCSLPENLLLAVPTPGHLVRVQSSLVHAGDFWAAVAGYSRVFRPVGSRNLTR